MKGGKKRGRRGGGERMGEGKGYKWEEEGKKEKRRRE